MNITLEVLDRSQVGPQEIADVESPEVLLPEGLAALRSVQRSATCNTCVFEGQLLPGGPEVIGNEHLEGSLGAPGLTVLFVLVVSEANEELEEFEPAEGALLERQSRVSR